MKNGKRLSLRHKKFLASKNLKPEDWLVVKDTPELVEFLHRKLKRTRTFQKA